MENPGDIKSFLKGKTFAVAGASTNQQKYGNKVFRCYLQNEMEVYPLNPRAEKIEGVKAYPDLASLPVVPDSLSIITPPAITEQVVEQAIEIGVTGLWMQPGAESKAAVDRAVEAGLNVVAGGPCLLVVLGYKWD